MSAKAWAWIALAVVLGFGAGCASKPVPVPPKAWEEAGRLSQQAARLQANGDWNGALAWWDRAARQYQLLNDRTNLAMAWHNQGTVRRALGRTDDATADLERAAALNAVLGQTNAWWRNQIALLQVANDAGKPGVGALLDRLDQEPGRPMGGKLAAILAQERARAWMAMGRLPEALSEAEGAVVEFERAGDRPGKAAAQVTCAKILRRLERFEESVRVWRDVLREFEAMGDPRGVAVSLAGWGGSLAALGQDRAMADALLGRAEANYRALGLTEEAARIAAEREALTGRAGE